MAWGYNPYITEKSPYHGAYLAVVESVSKLVATGAALKDDLSHLPGILREARARTPPAGASPWPPCWAPSAPRWSWSIAAIGGKDSMSGSFDESGRAAHPGLLCRHHGQDRRISSLLSSRPRTIRWSGCCPEYGRRRPARGGLPQAGLRDRARAHAAGQGPGRLHARLRRRGRGRAEDGPGQRLGLRVSTTAAPWTSCSPMPTARFVLELTEPQQIGLPLGATTAEAGLTWQGEHRHRGRAARLHTRDKLEPIYACNIDQKQENIPDPVPRERPAGSSRSSSLPSPRCSSPSSPAPTASTTRPRLCATPGPSRRSWSSTT